MSLEHELRGSRGSLWVWRQSKAQCLKDLGNAQELRSQGETLAVHSVHTPWAFFLNTSDHELAAGSLALVPFVLRAPRVLFSDT